jgi:hypothetical protein
MANPFDFSSGDVLTAANLNAIGDYEAFTPSWTNVTLGSGATNAGFAAEINELVFFEIGLVLGSSSSIGGSISFAVPVGTAASTINPWGPIGTAICIDVTGGVYAQCLLTLVGQTVYMHALLTSGTYGTRALNVNATRPFTWADGDKIYLQGMYRQT